MSELAMRASLCDATRRLGQHGLAGGACLAAAGWITPAGADPAFLRPDDLVKLGSRKDPAAELVAWALTQRKEAGAALLAAPPTVLGFALAGEALPDNLLPEAGMVLGSVAMVSGFALGSSPVDSLKPLLSEHKTLMLSHAGALVLGKDAGDCAVRLECLERCLRAWLVARLIGQPKSMPPAAFDLLLESGLSGKL